MSPIQNTHTHRDETTHKKVLNRLIHIENSESCLTKRKSSGLYLREKEKREKEERVKLKHVPYSQVLSDGCLRKNSGFEKSGKRVTPEQDPCFISCYPGDGRTNIRGRVRRLVSSRKGPPSYRKTRTFDCTILKYYETSIKYR